MFLRWIHKIWVALWRIILVLSIIILVVGGGTFGILQLDRSKAYLSNRLENEFNKAFYGKLSIGKLDGIIPFQIDLTDVRIADSDSSVTSDPKPVVAIDSVAIDLDLWDLIRKNLTITGFDIKKPVVRLISKGDSTYTLNHAFKSRIPRRSNQENLITQIEVVAPLMTLKNGQFYIDRFHHNSGKLNLPQPFKIDSLNIDMFLEMSQKQRFLDIEQISAYIPNVKTDHLNISGQIFNDQRYLEFNGFAMSLGTSKLGLTGEIDGVDLYKENWKAQLKNAHYDMVIDSLQFNSREFKNIYRGVPNWPDPITMNFDMRGNADSLSIDKFNLGFRNSRIESYGSVRHVLEPDKFSYRVHLSNALIQEADVRTISGPGGKKRFKNWDNVNLKGNLHGNRDTLIADVGLKGPIGNAQLQLNSRLQKPFRYSAHISTKHLDLGKVMAKTFSQTDINSTTTIKGMGLTLQKAVANLNTEVSNSQVNGTPLQNLSVSASMMGGYLEPQFKLQNDDEQLQGSGHIDFSTSSRKISFKGSAHHLDIAHFTHQKFMKGSSLNMDFNLDMQGKSIDDIYGRTSIDVHKSVINGDSVRAHQIYMDIDAPNQRGRHLRLTSSLFDLDLTGDITPTRIGKLTEYWGNYLQRRFKQEILFDTLKTQKAVSEPQVGNDQLSLTAQLDIKDIGLIKSYWPAFPDISTQSRLDANINADNERLLLTAGWRDKKTQVNDITIENPDAQLTAGFRYGEKLKDFSSIDLSATIGKLTVKTSTLENVDLNFSLKKDSVEFNQQVAKFSKNAQFNSSVSALLSDSAIVMNIKKFVLGNEEYTWHNEGNPRIIFRKVGAVSVHDFEFKNQQELFTLDGTFSKDRSDSVMYTFQNVNLQRISDLINGRIKFAGTLDANFSTRSLTSQPSIQGDINVNRFAVNNRLVGDVKFNSTFNPTDDHFNTNVSIVTDTTKYANYIKNNDGIGQKIYLKGYFKTPKPDVQQDTLYKFNLDFKEIDLWVLQPIIPNIFNKIEGRADGTGMISGNINNFNYHADFNVHNIYGNPNFINTNYWLDGPVEMDKDKGVVFHNVDIVDTKGGTGVLSGSIDLNDFQPEKFLNISLAMNKLQFLNNKFDRDVPFFGSVSGTGKVNVSGSTENPYMQTVQPVRVTSDSKLSIPLLDVTEVNQDNKFIRFVNSFDTGKQKGSSTTGMNGSQGGSGQEITPPSEKSFTELFNLDLQFEAPTPTTVELIFDPVTGEVLTANGTGQMNITLEDQEVRMFGQFNIESGEYQFVSGDIFSRKFQLERGGKISWQGDPDNANLDVTAIYRARPSISTLIGNESSASSSQQQQSQRIPVELVLQITGTVSSVNNNFYFRLPNTMEVSQSATITNRINSLNNNDEQKLLQATSLLLTGNFIPVSTPGGETSTALRQNLTGSSVVLNPLLSNQVLSPLLSNQINSLLNSDISSFDIDFNLNAYNQVDLGIALRLYNDRIILRREGQVTGPQSNIGDLGATFRINNTLSVTAFHRQDPTLSTVTSAQAQTEYLNGAGVEAQVQFNTWKDLKRRIFRTIKRIFTGKGKKEDRKEISESRIKKVHKVEN